MQQATTYANADLDICQHMAYLGHNELTYWDMNKMINMKQTNDISWIKFIVFLCKFHWT